MILSYDMILENLPRTDKQTDKQTNREFNYRGHSYPLWIVGGSGPILYALKNDQAFYSVHSLFTVSEIILSLSYVRPR